MRVVGWSGRVLAWGSFSGPPGLEIGFGGGGGGTYGLVVRHLGRLGWIGGLIWGALEGVRRERKGRKNVD